MYPCLKKKSSQREIDKIKRAMSLPPNLRGAIVDSGLSLRAIVADTQELGLLMEFNFIQEASFDCWIRDEWVSEQVFRGKNELLKRSERLLKRYLRRATQADHEFFDAPQSEWSLTAGADRVVAPGADTIRTEKSHAPRNV